MNGFEPLRLRRKHSVLAAVALAAAVVLAAGVLSSAASDAAADLAGQVSLADLARRFDIVGFDPRGIGSSSPVVGCQTAAERDAERAADLAADPSPAGVSLLEAQERVDNAAVTGPEPLAHVGTRDAVEDNLTTLTLPATGTVCPAEDQRVIPVCPSEYRPGWGHTVSPCGLSPTGILASSLPSSVEST